MRRRAAAARTADRRRRPARRGIALMDAIIGGVMLGVGLAVLISITSRSLARQTDGEKRLQAAWLADELLNMVLVEGPDEYSDMYDMEGRFEPPFEQFVFDVDIDDLGELQPYRVTATVAWGERSNDSIQVQTLIALRRYVEYENEEERDNIYRQREPLEPIDRDERWYGDEEEEL